MVIEGLRFCPSPQADGEDPDCMYTYWHHYPVPLLYKNYHHPFHFPHSTPTITTTTTTSSIMFPSCFLLTTSLPTLSLSQQCNPQDKKTLLQIKNQLGNPKQLSSWNPTTDCCKTTWKGVSCDTDTKTYRVIDLSLEYLNLPTPYPIPPSISNLPFLHMLYITHIPNLVGPIPPSISKLSKLQFLYISHTNVSGSIPEFMSRVKTLVSIDFSYNKLSGELPPSLSSLPNLLGVSFDGNMLTGPIPESYGNFSNHFTSITLSRNCLSGKVPVTLAKLNLAFVDWSRNRLEGDASVLFGSQKDTQKINLANNLLSFDLGKVGFSKDLNTLDLRNNRIYGKLPVGLTSLKYLHKLNVSYNNLCGEIPQGGNLQRFDENSYDHNKCLCGSPIPSCKTKGT